MPSRPRGATGLSPRLSGRSPCDPTRLRSDSALTLRDGHPYHLHPLLLTALPQPRTGVILASPGVTPSPFPTRAVAPETPFFYESSGLPCYAVQHAASGSTGAPVVVHVHGLGVEQVTLYRQETLAARAAAAGGFPVLRYHARGCGDSAGDAAAITLQTLVADARAAADEAKRRCGATRVVWVGVRFGAIVAAMAAAARTDTAGFVLWEPISRPLDQFRGQLRGMLFSSVAGGKKPDATVEQLFERITRDGAVDVHGYLLHRELIESCGDTDLASALQAAGDHPVQLLQIQQRGRLAPAHAALLESLVARGVKVGSACIAEEPGYQLISNPAWQSDAVTAANLEALRALA